LFGTLVNTAAIIAGSIIGMILKGGIPRHYSETVMQGTAFLPLYLRHRSASAYYFPHFPF